MRTLTLLINDNYYPEIAPVRNSSNIKHIIQLIFCFLLTFGFYSQSPAQWVSDPRANSKLVLDTKDPINISSVKDWNGGAFIFWQDSKSGSESQVYFIHVNAGGESTFQAGGKDVSALTRGKEDPVTARSLPNTALVAWRETGKYGKLFAQRVSSSGLYLWKNEGLALTDSTFSVSGYSAASDNLGNVYVSYVSKSPGINSNYRVEYRKISSDGRFVSDSASVVSASVNRKSLTSVVPDNRGGAFVYWLEYISNKTVLYIQHINENGRTDWGKNPLPVSEDTFNVINYKAKSFGSRDTYVAWQVLKQDKDIYHQVVTSGGKFLWGDGGRAVTKQKGNQINPNFIINDSTIYLSWTDDFKKDQDVYIQKFNRSGAPLWQKWGVSVIGINGSQFGQRIIADGSSGVILGWVDRRQDSVRADIYLQKISAGGKKMWDSLGVPAASHYNSQKSYLNLVSDDNGGVIAVFRENRNGKKGIYGQRVFNTGIYSSQIADFKPRLTDVDTVKSGAGNMGLFRDDSKIILAQNSPNPFSDSTSIKFFLPEKDSVTLEFYNGHLEKINELQKTFPAGENTVPFSAKGLEPGVYFYRLKAGDFVDVKKMVITKRING